MKPAYGFGMYEEDLLARNYTKLVPNVLVIASNWTNDHRFLGQQHANIVPGTAACIYDLREVDQHRLLTSQCKLRLTHASTRTELLAARQATSGTPRPKWPVKTFGLLSSPGKNASRNPIWGSEISSKWGDR